MELKDKVAVVTGGAMGNGLGIVKVFLKEGAKVAILDVADSLENTLKDSMEITPEWIKSRKLITRILQSLLKLFAPLM